MQGYHAHSEEELHKLMCSNHNEQQDCLLNGNGIHCCVMYHNEEEHQQLSTKYIIEGLQQNCKVGYFYHHHSLEVITEQFRAVGFDIRPHVDSGKLSFYKACDVYVGDGHFDPERTIEALKTMTLKAQKEGYDRFRVTGEMSWAHPSYRVRGNHRLMEYETKLAYFFDNYPCDALCQYDMRVFDSSFLLSVLNTHPTAMIGIEEYDNIYYMPPSEFLVEDLATSTLKHWIKNLKERKSIEERLRSRTKELLISNERLVKEIEERRKMQTAKESAEAVSKAQQCFLRTMSHELRTPLNGIMCMSDLLGKTTLSIEQQEYNSVINVSSRHLLSVLSDMLDYSRLETNEVKIAKRSFSIESCVKSAISTVKQLNDNPGIEIKYTIAPDCGPYIFGDANRVKQVLYNLVGNAVKFTTQTNGVVNITVSRGPFKSLNDNQIPNSPSLEVRTRGLVIQDKPNDDFELVFCIKDSGIGIPSDKWSVIFDSFKQLDSSTTRKFDGTGLGLSICKKLVTLMGGSIWLESQVGVGSTFYFSIPTQVARDHLPDYENVKNDNGKRVAQPTKKLLKILVAEDNLINQKVAQKIFDKLNHSVTIVANGYEAVNEVERGEYDCVFMDLLMPVMGGLEATRIISNLDFSRKKKPRPSIIAMTASASDEDRQMCYQAGMDYHISKPINIEIVRQTVDMLEKGKEKHLKTLDFKNL